MKTIFDAKSRRTYELDETEHVYLMGAETPHHPVYKSERRVRSLDTIHRVNVAHTKCEALREVITRLYKADMRNTPLFTATKSALAALEGGL